MDPEKARRVNMCHQSLQMLHCRRYPIEHVTVEDESWVYCWDPQPKQATREWLTQGQE